MCKALWSVGDQALELAVKTLISSASEDDKIKFLQEAAIMGQFSHPNVIKLYGVVTVGEPVSLQWVMHGETLTSKASLISLNAILLEYIPLQVMICSELLANGDLRSYLQTFVTDSGGTEGKQPLFLRFSKEIAAGMNYLSQKSFVHRDLAARNILLNHSLTCKVSWLCTSWALVLN